MKNIFSNTIKISALAVLMSFSSCKKFIDILPVGDGQIPTTLADYEALIRDEYGNHRAVITQAVLLLNDKFETVANLNYYPLDKANYNWDETANRIALNNSDETTYYANYSGINTSNLIIEHANETTEGTPAQKAELIGQAKVLRALDYDMLVNYYADTYEEANAATKLSVPLILSADIGAPYTQVSIKELYDFILKDIDEAIPALGATSATVLHPNLGSANALKARVLLQMGRYSEALAAANEALKYNDKLFDWPAFYATYKTQIEAPGIYTNAPTPMGFNYVENYYFRHGTTSSPGRESAIRTDRAPRFEQGDAKFASRWKLRTVGADTYFTSITTGYFNVGGLTTTEVYLIKAECQARLNDVPGAMTTLNTVRAKRIFAANYTPLSAASTIDAVKLIQRTKGNELIMSIVPFADARRLNKDPNYATPLTKTENGQALTLSPNSHLWTMPFPMGASKNPGNGTIKQNVDK
ncbi:RagB/SusD family nutrient uptake outer membrane protein [Pedobacter sp. MR2016-24]|uniref:RagB/SusD family nutrient uptake outer membrane protein n=1 Tax=Pedobacter sp. MR2016-24 TaxID=2994466 RepID=UPI0022477F63|nr:RagB/SusD family nutrient uptake outer membrane protein [Pedobacter sp. MR2016-24]MCX2486254.1 RagB/SusD family nutrient uptake outer membrane protein [Pedobacter sp. MR2016-24]